MLPRKRLDIGLRDLAYGAAVCLAPGSRRAAARRIEQYWSPGREAVVTLSVRSGFDLLLQALRLPAGSEILVSAVTIRDMVRIVEEHGLVPVPVDMDMDTLSVSMEALERAWSPRSKAILVAHLFGSRAPIDEVAGFARRKGLLLIEDCAQSLLGPDDRGHPLSDVTLFSFGPIKTNTALGGGIVGVRDLETRSRMRALQRGYPLATRGWFLCRVLKYVPVTMVLRPFGMTILSFVARFCGTTQDAIISRALRGFPGANLFRKLRRRPPYPMLALLLRRLSRFRDRHVRERTWQGDAAARMMRDFPRPGTRAAVHTHWVFPVWPREPDALMRHLWSRGFDATRGASSLAAVNPVASRPEITAPCAREAMARTLFIPVYPEVPLARLSALVRAIEEYERGPGQHVSEGPVRAVPHPAGIAHAGGGHG